jgi:hypothetical protein
MKTAVTTDDSLEIVDVYFVSKLERTLSILFVESIRLVNFGVIR